MVPMTEKILRVQYDGTGCAIIWRANMFGKSPSWKCIGASISRGELLSDSGMQGVL